MKCWIPAVELPDQRSELLKGLDFDYIGSLIPQIPKKDFIHTRAKLGAFRYMFGKKGEAQMHILQMISKNDKYGAQSVFLNQILALMGKGNEIVIVGRGRNGFIPDKVKSIGLPYYGIPMNGLKDILFLRRLIRRYNIDIVHTALDRADYLGLVVSKISRRPVISTNMVPRYLAGFRFMDRVVVLSKKQKGLLEKRGIKPEKIALIRPGIDVNRFSMHDKVKSGLWKERLQSWNYSIIFCHIASLIPRKAHVISLEVIAECKKRGEEPLLIIIGDPLYGDYYMSILSKINHLGLNNNVYFTGWTSELPEILSLSHFTILPSEDEALGVVLIEGMAAGTPIIAREGEGGAELIEEFGTGFLYSPVNGVGPLVDSILMLFHNNPLYLALSKKCIDISKSVFSLSRFGQCLIETYEEAGKK